MVINSPVVNSMANRAPPKSRHLAVLAGDITDQQRNGGKMTGAEKNGDHAPEKAAQGAKQNTLPHPLNDGEIQ
jgi:hypothetical protein